MRLQRHEIPYKQRAETGLWTARALFGYSSDTTKAPEHFVSRSEVDERLHAVS